MPLGNHFVSFSISQISLVWQCKILAGCSVCTIISASFRQSCRQAVGRPGVVRSHLNKEFRISSMLFTNPLPEAGSAAGAGSSSGRRHFFLWSFSWVGLWTDFGLQLVTGISRHSWYMMDLQSGRVCVSQLDELLTYATLELPTQVIKINYILHT